MILIFSIKKNEATTTDVIKWIDYLSGEWLRLNGNEFKNLKYSFNIGFDDSKPQAELEVDGRSYDLSNVKSVWFRKMARIPEPDVSVIGNNELEEKIKKYCSRELDAAKKVLDSVLSNANWLSEPETSSPNKFNVLLKAVSLGLTVPKSILTSKKVELKAFKEYVGVCIVKNIQDSIIIQREKVIQSMYTEVLNSELLNELPDTFFPVFAQECVEKAYELRVFFLNGVCYPMAIFSQLDPQTLIDVRMYNFKRPNRSVPYNLPKDIEACICELMAWFKWCTGSIDLIRGVNGNYYFLEVNPVGQFGNVSVLCNYGLERKVASYLIEKDKYHEQ